MKRSELKRRVALKVDPTKRLAQKSPLSGRAAPLRRTKPLPRAKRQTKAPAAAQSPTAAEFRDAVWLADGGRCVMCGTKLPRGAGPWAWVAHHPVQKQHLDPALRRSAEGAILLCRRGHERHHSRTRTVPFERLPRRVLSFAARLGPAAEDRLLREHPPQPEGGPPWPTT